MKAVIQRVRSASVEVEGEIVGQIGHGLLVLLGAAKDDNERDVDYLADKIPQLRIFADESCKMNRSLIDVCGKLLLVSQFTLLGETDKGRRPAFDAAASPDLARRLYELVIEKLKRQDIHVETGLFGASMLVTLQNEGPVTFLLDSRRVNRDKIR